MSYIACWSGLADRGNEGGADPRERYTPLSTVYMLFFTARLLVLRCLLSLVNV